MHGEALGSSCEDGLCYLRRGVMLDNWKVVTRRDLHWMREIIVDREKISAEEALKRAEDAGMDLVVVNEKPLVGKIIDYKKHLYEEGKRKKEALKKQRESIQKTKEVKFHISIGDADYLHKMKQIEEFIEEGDRVDVKIVMRGREASGNADFIKSFQDRVVESVSQVGMLIKQPNRDGKVISMSVVKRR